MRKLMKAFCSTVCVMSLAMPADVMADPTADADDIMEDHFNIPDDGEDYCMVFTRGEFDAENMSTEPAERSGSMVLFISRPDGRLVTDAQVITTLIDSQGTQTMSRARQFLGGYLIASTQLPPGSYRMEAEVITDSRLLTNEFTFKKT